ncbi:MAG: hypothetical protein QXU40_04215 [Candidatus Pacearchaeota archaeon]
MKTQEKFPSYLKKWNIGYRRYNMRGYDISDKLIDLLAKYDKVAYNR